MKIKIQHKFDTGGNYTAWINPMVGMCKVGRGRTWREALGDLVAAYPNEFGTIEVLNKDGTPYKFEPERRKYLRER